MLMEIILLEILKDPTNVGMYGIRGASGVIAINTEKNSTLALRERDPNLIIRKIPGYLKESSIYGYAPGSGEGYGLIYWNANLQTDDAGEVELVLPGVDLPDHYFIFIEGITSYGLPFNHKMKINNLSGQKLEN